ncbi:MAG: ribosomal-processing cysteine protease Prp [Clostridia bacterium]|jgi:uncharacterized protein YsxB (DUF464 family)|nr:ribosomal-processing cysteine protease Prp [Clostridia bacterium]
MTKIIFFRSNGQIYGFRESGHAGFAERGDDIVCAAISAMTMLMINTIEDGYGARVSYDINEDDTVVLFKSKSALSEFEEDEKKVFAISNLLLSYHQTLESMVEDNYEYLEVSIQDIDYDESGF